MSRKKDIAKMVDADNEELPEIVFAPGCFDTFDGTQEELDALKDEILAMFVGKTKEELLEMGRPMTVEDLEDLPEGIVDQFVAGLNGETRNLH